MAKASKIKVKETEISVIVQNEIDYICLTDMAAGFNEGSGLIGKWITNKNTLEYLGIWEKINNPDFNYPEFGVIEKEAGINRFIMSAGQWIDRTKALGMLVRAGRYGGTYAHKDIAFHFAMWLSPKFQIYLVNEYQRLKADERELRRFRQFYLVYPMAVQFFKNNLPIRGLLSPESFISEQISETPPILDGNKYLMNALLEYYSFNLNRLI